jgi:microcystin-dependent protein
MRNCGCSGNTCACSVIGGAGIEVTGTGTKDSPFVVRNTGAEVRSSVAVADSSTLDLSITGLGTPSEPVTISGTVHVTLAELDDVADQVASVGNVPTWDGTQWVPLTPAAAPAGAVRSGAGLVGDGSVGAPLRANPSGTFGQGKLAGYGTDPLVGSEVYTDGSGKLRGVPQGSLPVFTTATMPTARIGVMVFVSDTQQVMLGTNAGWVPYGGGAPVGSVVAFAGGVVPSGWLIAGGQSLPRGDYAQLFAVIGTAYGAASDSTFSLPALGGRVPVGRATADPEFSALGKTGGTKTHRLTTDEMPSHTHDLANGATELISNAASGTLYKSQGGDTFSYRASRLNPAGGGMPHNNLQPYITLNYIIRAS